MCAFFLSFNYRYPISSFDWATSGTVSFLDPEHQALCHFLLSLCPNPDHMRRSKLLHSTETARWYWAYICIFKFESISHKNTYICVKPCCFADNFTFCNIFFYVILKYSEPEKLKQSISHGKKRISDQILDSPVIKRVFCFELLNWKKKKDPKPERAFHLVALSIKIPINYSAINYGCASFHIIHLSQNLLLLWSELSRDSSHPTPLKSSRPDQCWTKWSKVIHLTRSLRTISVHRMGLGLRGIFIWVLVPTWKGKGQETGQGRKNFLQKYTEDFQAYILLLRKKQNKRLKNPKNSRRQRPPQLLPSVLEKLLQKMTCC